VLYVAKANHAYQECVGVKPRLVKRTNLNEAKPKARSKYFDDRNRRKVRTKAKKTSTSTRALIGMNRGKCRKQEIRNDIQLTPPVAKVERHRCLISNQDRRA